MFQNIYQFLLTRGLVVMISGFLIALAGVMIYYFTHSRFAFWGTIAGIAIYLVGRVFVAIQRKKQRASNNNID